MNDSIQSILFRRKSKVFFNFDNTLPDTKDTTGMIGAVLANFGSLGYVLDAKLITKLNFASASEIEKFYKEMLPIIQGHCGAYYYKPMYPNFPSQVANASDEELYINAILHYFGDAIGERIMPKYDEEIRFPFCELTTARWIGLGTEEDVSEMFSNIFESKASPSYQDKEDIKTFFEFCDSPISIPLFSNKEKMSYVLAYILKGTGEKTFNLWSKDNVKTATDVLRIAVAYSNGDESLSKVTKFGKFSRPLRRIILNALNQLDQDNVMEDMKRHEGMWIRLGEKLHPSEHFSTFPSIGLAFSKLRNGEIQTTNSKIEKFLSSSDWNSLINILKTRPGDFARRMNALLSKADNRLDVITGFREVATKVSSPVLWQLYGYFKNRETLLSYKNRLFIPKGSVSKALVSVNNLTEIPKSYTQGLCQVVLNSLREKYLEKSLGIEPNSSVWINPLCKDLLIPTGNRTASTALRQVGRGSRFQIGNLKSTIRLFVYWKDVEGNKYDNRVDLDLSAIKFDENWKPLGHCSWTQLRNGGGRNTTMIHSGDITSAPDGASEFLDINLNLLEPEVRYIGVNVYCYTGQQMKELDVAFCGWMEREYAGSGEIYEPKSVVGKADLTAETTSTCPMILDVKTREIIWCDMALTLSQFCSSVENTMDATIATADLITRMSSTRANLYDLFTTNISAQGLKLVDNREEADYIIDEDGDLSPYDIAKITSIWL
jgi:stress response protein SCP2